MPTSGVRVVIVPPSRGAPPTPRRLGSNPRRSHLDHRLAHVEGFGKSVRCATLEPPQPHQAEERVVSEPVTILLAGKSRSKMPHLSVSARAVNRHEQIGNAEIAVVLRDLVLDDEVIPECVPRQVGNDSMILMPIVSIVREYHVGRELPAQFLEVLLDFVADVGKEPIAKGSDRDRGMSSVLQEQASALLRFPGAKLR